MTDLGGLRIFKIVCFFGFVTMLIIVLERPAFANYGYHCNKYGECFFRDDSNDGNPYNNANFLGLNDYGHPNIPQYLVRRSNDYDEVRARAYQSPFGALLHGIVESMEQK